jgi:hypothetical protein
MRRGNKKDRKVTYNLCLLTAVAILFYGCAIGESWPQKENSIVKPAQMGTFDGENRTLDNGTTYSWVTLDREVKSFVNRSKLYRIDP